MAAGHYLGWPNRITLARLFLIGPFSVCLLNLNEPGKDWLRRTALAVYALMALSDFLDGWLARRLHDESPLGKFLDPLADKLLVTISVLFLGISGIVRMTDGEPVRFGVANWVVVAAIGKDLVVSIGFALVYLTTGRVFIQARRVGKWCTAVQLVLVLVVLLAWDLPRAAWPATDYLSYLATGLAVAAALDYVVLGVRYVGQAAANGESPES